tara:strand:- start:412 stop:654 length:243 start_codon:yes stop_codon:yes gene_type:complete
MKGLAALLLCAGCSTMPGLGTADLAIKAGVGCVSGGLKAVSGIVESAGEDASGSITTFTDLLWDIVSGALVSVAVSANGS